MVEKSQQQPFTMICLMMKMYYLEALFAIPETMEAAKTHPYIVPLLGALPLLWNIVRHVKVEEKIILWPELYGRVPVCISI